MDRCLPPRLAASVDPTNEFSDVRHVRNFTLSQARRSIVQKRIAKGAVVHACLLPSVVTIPDGIGRSSFCGGAGRDQSHANLHDIGLYVVCARARNAEKVGKAVGFGANVNVNLIVNVNVGERLPQPTNRM